MAKKANRKMIGGFVVMAVAILVASVVIFGGGQFFKKTEKYVLYFDGSVKGLQIGSPVLFSGVPVGVVTNIVLRAYMKELISYIPVFIEIDPERLELIWEGAELGKRPLRSLPRAIEKGLRAQLVTQSMITGQLMIEIQMRPDTPIDLKNLDEGYQEIPTIPSVLAKLSKSLERLDLNKINASLTSILTSVDKLLKNPDIDASLAELKGALQDARGLVQHVDVKVDPLTDNLNSTIKDTRKLVNDVDGEVKPLAGKAKSTLNDFGKLARKMDAKVDPLSESVIDALKTAKSALNSIDDLVSKDSPTRADLENLLQELSGAARSFRFLADYLEQHPDALLKGKGYKTY